jgi:hypothetical protein
MHCAASPMQTSTAERFDSEDQPTQVRFQTDTLRPRASCLPRSDRVHYTYVCEDHTSRTVKAYIEVARGAGFKLRATELLRREEATLVAFRQMATPHFSSIACTGHLIAYSPCSSLLGPAFDQEGRGNGGTPCSPCISIVEKTMQQAPMSVRTTM